MSDVSARWTIWNDGPSDEPGVSSKCYVDGPDAGNWAGDGVEVVPAAHLAGAVEEIERLRDELEDTRADWARMKGVAERRGKAVEALREVARLLGRSTSTSTQAGAGPTDAERAALTIANGALERLQKATLGE